LEIRNENDRLDNDDEILEVGLIGLIRLAAMHDDVR
jgi:hypothetical protein